MAVCPKCEHTYPKVGMACTNSICVPDNIHAIYEQAIKQAANDPRIGKITADKFVITGRISKGGMGAVYTAMQMPVEREVALKVLRTEMEDSDQGRDRFIQEAKAISRLTHPNIITLFDFGFEETGHPYMVMEYAPGMHLGKWAKQEDLTIERISMVVQQLLSALDEAHSQRIVHRDLKPENMIVIQKGSQQDYVKLLDFGIARVVTESSTRGITREGEVFGTPHYMAPEQAQGSKDIGPTADIYAVGIIMHYLICGTEPFDADSAVAILLKHINTPLPALTPRPGILVTPAIEAIVERACQKSAGDRFQSAKEMIAALIDATINPDSPGLLTGAYIGVNHKPSAASDDPPTPEAVALKPEVVVPALVAKVPPPLSGFSQEYLATVPPPKKSSKTIIAILGIICLLLVVGGVVFMNMEPEVPEGQGGKVVTTTPTPPATVKKTPPKEPETEDPEVEGTASNDKPTPEDPPSIEENPEETPVEPPVETPKDPEPVAIKAITKTPPKKPVIKPSTPEPSKTPEPAKKPEPVKTPEPDGPTKFTFKPTVTKEPKKPTKFALPPTKPKKFDINN